MDDPGGTLMGMEAGADGPGSVTSMEPTVTAPAEPRRDPTGRDGTLDAVDLAFLAPTQRSGSLGKIGGYDVYGVVGLGGMGVVLRAVDKALSRTVAVKVQKPLLALDSRSRGMFLREARAVAAIRHPNVVTIYSVNVVRGRPYLVMEYIAGGSLRQRIKGGPALSTVEVLQIGLQIARGLAAAHKEGLIHRDIKPANILLDGPSPTVKITDFGLAVTHPRLAAIASGGRIVGTPAYMSPEQVRGDTLDARSDLFSLGCVLYAMVAGGSPFTAPGLKEIVDRVREHHPEPLRDACPGCPDAVSELVATLLQKAPEARPASAQDVADRLAAILDGASRDEPPAADAPPPAEAPPRRRWLATVASASLAAVMALGGAARLFVDWSQPGRAVLTVSQTLPASCRSLDEALRRVGPGETIRLLDSQTYDGALLVDDPIRHRGLTIEAAAGATLIASGDEPAVVQVRNVTDVTLRRLTILTHENQFGLCITGSDEGATLDRVRFIGPPAKKPPATGGSGPR